MARFIPGGRTATTFIAGRTAYPLSRFTPVTIVAGLLWAGFATMLGYIGGSTFHDQTLLATGLGILLALGFGALMELVMSWRRRSEAVEPPADDQARRPRRLSGRPRPRRPAIARGPPSARRVCVVAARGEGTMGTTVVVAERQEVVRRGLEAMLGALEDVSWCSFVSLEDLVAAAGTRADVCLVDVAALRAATGEHSRPLAPTRILAMVPTLDQAALSTAVQAAAAGSVLLPDLSIASLGLALADVTAGRRHLPDRLSSFLLSWVQTGRPRCRGGPTCSAPGSGRCWSCWWRASATSRSAPSWGSRCTAPSGTCRASCPS